MEQAYCNSIKDAMIAFLGNEIVARESRDGCVLVLPNKTLDDRFVTVFVDRKANNYFVVHDAGKTASELHAQGVHITDIRGEAFSQMAERLGASFSDGIFKVVCNLRDLHAAVLAIGECESLGMWHLIGHKPDLAEEPVKTRIERGIGAWHPEYGQRLEKNVRVKGNKANHIFDFVSYPDVDTREPIAIKVLSPSDDPLGKAREYGFLVYDTEKTYFEKWLRLAVLTKADRWSRNAKQLVASLSTNTVEVDAGEEDTLERRIPAALELMAA